MFSQAKVTVNGNAALTSHGCNQFVGITAVVAVQDIRDSLTRLCLSDLARQTLTDH